MLTKIYVLKNENGEIRYVGKTTLILNRRFGNHLAEARRGDKNHRCDWIRSMLKRGLTPTIVEIGNAPKDGIREEIAWIKYFRDEGVDLTNSTDGGEGVIGWKPTQETKNKISRANKVRWQKDRSRLLELAKKRKWHYSDECRKARSERMKGNQLGKGHSPSKETRLKMSQNGKGNRYGQGFKHTAEWKHIKSEAMKGNRLNLGRHPSSETRLKMSLRMKGNTFSKGLSHTNEHKRKISASLYTHYNALRRVA